MYRIDSETNLNLFVSNLPFEKPEIGTKNLNESKKILVELM